MADNIFQKIIDREAPADIVYETEEVLAFKDINPCAPVHVLVIPKRHITRLREAEGSDEAVLGKLLLAAAEVAREQGIEESGYRVVINNGRDAGEIVPHLHVHVLGGQNLGSLPGG
jgi:histidine triad (HIT) family protein